MILQRLESLPVGNFHYKLLLLTGLGWLFDSMDTGLIAFVLPVLAKEWALTPAQVGWIGSIGLIGMALGAVLAGTLADRIGRKRVFSLTVLLYSLSTGMCALSWSYESLLVFRFLVGFGLGGELPVAATLMSEYAPAHLRGRFIVLLESFWGVGWLVAACISYLLIPAFGWQIAFVIGTLPALYVFLIRLHMPESIRYLLTKNRIKEAQDVIHLGLQAVIGEQSTDTLLVRRDAGNNISALGCELSGQGIEQEDSFIYAHVVVSGFLYPVDMILEVRGERTTLGISEETLEEEVPEPFRRKQ